MESELSFPPPVRGRRDDCPACGAIIGDNPHLADPAKVFDQCDHSGLNYHALGQSHGRRYDAHHLRLPGAGLRGMREI
jgi:hypothetical protein